MTTATSTLAPMKGRPIDDSVDVLAEHLKETLEEIEGRPYTLADAVREGCLVTDQAIGASTNPAGEACALQAAFTSIQARKKALSA